MTARIPIATYRLQLNKGFTFRAAIELIEYLDTLGISDVYASPFLKARPGSVHGYDVTDPEQLNPEIGDEAALDELSTQLRNRGMGLLADVVPNHMCISGSENRWWLDVLENGPSSYWARTFDIDWHPPKLELHNKVLLPFLGDQYGRALEAGQIQIGYEAGAFFTRYYEFVLPNAPRSAPAVLTPLVKRLRAALGDAAPAVVELESITTAVQHLPPRTETDEERVKERYREKEIIKRRLATLVDGDVDVRRHLDDTLRELNGIRGVPSSFDALEQLLGQQGFRLAFWKVAADEINYRRFFDINDLAAIRVEDAAVLKAVHGKIFAWLQAGKITGLRVDHVDGLLEPARYLRELQHTCAGDDEAAAARGARSCYVVVEKILGEHEPLPRDWPVHGTTGYDALNLLAGVFIDRRNEKAFRRIYEHFRELPGTFDDVLYRSRRLILRTAMSSELYVLARKLDSISEQHRWSRDFTLHSLHHALSEVIANFPVYRTYIGLETEQPGQAEAEHVHRAIEVAKRRNPADDASVFNFIRDVLLLRDPDGIDEAARAQRRDFVLRLQQLTGPVMAKGLEDTACYRHVPLASLSEVGRRPDNFGTSLTAFHAANAERNANWPHGLVATATHDTKRGEDMRIRLGVLSEVPAEWLAALRRWQRANRRYRTVLDATPAPHPNEEYLLYQTLVGAWPPGPALDDERLEQLTERVAAYMQKALREAKLHSSWVSPNEPYERAVDSFVRTILQRRSDNVFLEDLEQFLNGIIVPGLLSSLSQLVLKLAVPGVPDFYQGCELWDFSLVDPDNRRPVDYASRRAILADLVSHDGEQPAQLVARLLESPWNGAIKMHVVRAGLALRRRKISLFNSGGYAPVWADGPRADHVVAFARARDGEAVLATGARFFTALGAHRRVPVGAETWTSNWLPLPPALGAGTYRDTLAGAEVTTVDRGGGVYALPLEQVFQHLPVALLEKLR